MRSCWPAWASALGARSSSAATAPRSRSAPRRPRLVTLPAAPPIVRADGDVVAAVVPGNRKGRCAADRPLAARARAGDDPDDRPMRRRQDRTRLGGRAGPRRPDGRLAGDERRQQPRADRSARPRSRDRRRRSCRTSRTAAALPATRQAIGPARPRRARERCSPTPRGRNATRPAATTRARAAKRPARRLRPGAAPHRRRRRSSPDRAFSGPGLDGRERDPRSSMPIGTLVLVDARGRGFRAVSGGARARRARSSRARSS